MPHSRVKNRASGISSWLSGKKKTDLPRSTNVVPSWSFGEYVTRTTFGSLKHNFDNDWTLDLKAAQSTAEALNHRGLAKVNSAGRGTFAAGCWLH